MIVPFFDEAEFLRMYETGVRFCRIVSAVSGERCSCAWREQG